MDAPRHEIVHQIVTSCDGRKHAAHQRGFLAFLHIAIAKGRHRLSGIRYRVSEKDVLSSAYPSDTGPPIPPTRCLNSPRSKPCAWGSRPFWSIDGSRG